jgi:hypothetical protein
MCEFPVIFIVFLYEYKKKLQPILVINKNKNNFALIEKFG